MEIIGRVTADAQVKTLKDKREVVSFSIAINDYYRDKDGEKHNTTTYINCSYWISSKIAKSLTKGSIVSLFGRIGLNAYKGMDGEFNAYLTFHVNSIKIIASYKKQGGSTALVEAGVEADKDNLPF